MDNLNVNNNIATEQPVDVAALEKEMAKLDKEFATQMQECNKTVEEIKQSTQRIANNYAKQDEIVGKYCDEAAKIADKYSELEEREVAKYVEKRTRK